MQGIGRRAALGLATAIPALAPALAQTWPARPVRLVVPFPPGGPAYVLARLLAERLTEAWGQPVVVENRGGAGGNIGAAPDGYTLLIPASSHVQGAALYQRLPFDPLRDFTAVSVFAYYALVLVAHPGVAPDLAGLLALALARPGAVTFASAGAGTPTHLAAEVLRIRAGVEFTHVPFQGAAPAHAAPCSAARRWRCSRTRCWRFRRSAPASSPGWRRRGQAGAAIARIRRPWRKAASPASRSAPGTPCSARPACHRNWRRGSMPM